MKEVGKEVGGNNFYKSEISRNDMGALLVSLSRGETSKRKDRELGKV